MMLAFVLFIFQSCGVLALSQSEGCSAEIDSDKLSVTLLQQDLSILGTASEMPVLGSSSCPCVGIQNAVGHVVGVSGTEKFYYPAEVGSSCDTWDKDFWPSCQSSNATFCSQPWCFVNPCNCKGLDALPKKSLVLKGATFQGMPLYYSYATCGATDSYSAGVAAACVNQKTETACTALSDCVWSGSLCMGKELASACDLKPDPSWAGAEGCRCIGLAGSNGTVAATYPHNLGVEYPAEVGASCQAWDDTVHKDCLFQTPQPSWCKNKWCYVDPCSCSGVNAPPKSSLMLEGAKYKGKGMYYSYAACGASDSFTSANHATACVNQETESDCSANPKCGWTGTACLGKELVSACSAESGAATTKPFLVMASLALFLKF